MTTPKHQHTVADSFNHGFQDTLQKSLAGDPSTIALGCVLWLVIIFGCCWFAGWVLGNLLRRR